MASHEPPNGTRHRSSMETSPSGDNDAWRFVALAGDTADGATIVPDRSRAGVGIDRRPRRLLRRSRPWPYSTHPGQRPVRWRAAPGPTARDAGAKQTSFAACRLHVTGHSAEELAFSAPSGRRIARR